MKGQKKNTNYDRMPKSGYDSWSDPANEILRSPEDMRLERGIAFVMRGQLDMEEVMDDPYYCSTDSYAAELVSGYIRKTGTEEEKYIRRNLSLENYSRTDPKELSEINQEIHQNNVDKLAESWVEEWNLKGNSGRDSRSSQREAFIKESLEKEIPPENEIRRPFITRTVFYRYIAPIAAILSGVIFLIRILSPSDSVKLYTMYYKPFVAIESVTRGIGESENTINTAIEYYNQGRYQKALTAFSEIPLNDKNRSDASFFSGITYMALGQYEDAAASLEIAAKVKGEFEKEALWYLGLVYLKMDNLEGAITCFRKLSESPGFYNHRALKILRRLK